MKIIKILTVAALILSFAVYGVSVITEYAEKDDTLPEIYSDREVLEATCATVGEHLTDGLSAQDGNDGDLTAQIVAGSATRFVTPGKYDVTYAVFDLQPNGNTDKTGASHGLSLSQIHPEPAPCF